MSYFPISSEDQQVMLDAIGVENFGQILQGIPVSLRNPQIQVPESLSEHEIRGLFSRMAKLNLNTKDTLSFLGAGAYEHYIPATVNAIISRSEFYTAYTPYQAEASQGTLQTIFEYQSLMCELTGMDVSNGSHYDGSTALAEAALLSLNKTKRNKILIARSVHPEFRKVIETYVGRIGATLIEIACLGDGKLDRASLKAGLDSDVASVILSNPNFFGNVEDLSGIAELIHKNESLFILTGNPLAFSFFKTPAEWGADIACGEAQPLGVPMSFGGPWLGYFTTTRALVRQIPGRLVGLTKDSDGKRAFCLTLQAREQHIRREKASSNICTNQALCAIAACVYMASLGRQGMRHVAELNMENANYLRDEIGKLNGVEIVSQDVIFNEFIARMPVRPAELNQKLLNKEILGGLDVERFYPEFENGWLLCATETKSKEEIDRFVEAVKECVR